MAFMMGGTKRACKRRRYGVPRLEQVRPEEWAGKMALAGSEGGCRAAVVGRFDDEPDAAAMHALCRSQALLYPPAAAPMRTDEEILEEVRSNWERLTRAVTRPSLGRAVPRWALPWEVWRGLLMGVTEELQGWLEGLLVLVHSLRRTPSLWHVSSGCGIDKPKGGQRMVHLLDPMGKLW